MDSRENASDQQQGGDVVAKAPSMEKMYRVAIGQVEWSPEERAWLDQNPERHERQQGLRKLIREIEGDRNQQATDFARRVDGKSKKEPPSRG